MKTRIITGAVFVAVLIPVFIFSNTYLFNAVIALVSLTAAYEMLACFGLAQKWEISLPTYVITMIFPILARLLAQGQISLKWLILIGLMYTMFLLSAMVFTKGEITMENIALIFLATAYITVAFSSIVLIHDLPEYGEYMYLLIFIGAFITDTFAYFTGRFFGKHKLIEEISPNKTVEGSIGGIIFCSLAFVVYGIILVNWFGVTGYNLFALAIAGVVVSIVAQMGDLVCSAIKRNFGKKDFGSLFPGHGGVLDRFDSIMAIAPFLLLLYMIIDGTQSFAMFG